MALAWERNLDSYDELRALRFEAETEIDKAIDLLWDDKLRNCPFDLAGGMTLVVPLRAVPLFGAAGLQFEDTRVLWSFEISAEEMNEVRRQ